jgi:hypothetical protein
VFSVSLIRSGSFKYQKNTARTGPKDLVFDQDLGAHLFRFLCRKTKSQSENAKRHKNPHNEKT